MNAVSLEAYGAPYLRALTDDVIPFWERHGPDRECGGFFSCLDRDGSVYDPAKYMWMQWRIVYQFAELCAKLKPRPAWRALAEDGFRFLTAHGRDPQGRCYFALNRRGEPAVAPYSPFSECFAAMGAAALYRVNGDPAAAAEARRAYAQYCAREARPKGEWTKELPGAPAFDSLAFHMMKANLQLVLRECLGDPAAAAEVPATVDAVLDGFWNTERRMLFENIRPGGGFDLETPAGRQLNPGHALEAMWFILAAGAQFGRRDWIARAADIALAELELGWDPEHGGIFYFLDAAGRPRPELEWSMKLWWVHCEALIACALAFHLTGRAEFAAWFERVHAWAWARFPDPECGEWYGYLDRSGTPTHRFKGGKWKTFFHLPRMLLFVGRLLRDGLLPAAAAGQDHRVPGFRPPHAPRPQGQ